MFAVWGLHEGLGVGRVKDVGVRPGRRAIGSCKVYCSIYSNIDHTR